MTDPYGLTAHEPRRPEPAGSFSGSAMSTLLWLVLAVSAVLNIVSSTIGGVGVVFNVVSGLVMLGCGALLFARHRKQRGRA